MEISRPFVVVVSGLPRSGTSLVMQMLEVGGMPVLRDDVRLPDEHNPKGYLEYAPVKRLGEDASWVPEARGCAVKVLYHLVPLLPPSCDYRLILVRRELRQVLASQDAMIGDRRPPRLRQERLVSIFCTQLQQLESWIEAQPNFRLLRVEHRELLADPLHLAGGMNEFLGGGLDVAAMAKAVDPALHRQRG